ncbi:hypothetical protein S245_050831 [Arachis hypogaea]|nr:uncharacterized protein DS421_15g489270 [Arachis hypogaea]
MVKRSLILVLIPEVVAGIVVFFFSSFLSHVPPSIPHLPPPHFHEHHRHPSSQSRQTSPQPHQLNHPVFHIEGEGHNIVKILGLVYNYLRWFEQLESKQARQEDVKHQLKKEMQCRKEANKKTKKMDICTIDRSVFFFHRFFILDLLRE